MSPEITVLIPSLISRRESLRDLLGDCERERLTAIVLVDAGGISLGRKMDLLADAASGEWMAGAGDDDRLLPGYGDALREACEAAPEWVGGVYFHVAYTVSDRGQVLRSGLCRKRPGTLTVTGDDGTLVRPPADRTCLRADVRRRLRHPDKYWSEDYEFARTLWDNEVGMIPVRDLSAPLYLAQHREDDPHGTDFKQAKDAPGAVRQDPLLWARSSYPMNAPAMTGFDAVAERVLSEPDMPAVYMLLDQFV